MSKYRLFVLILVVMDNSLVQSFETVSAELKKVS